MVSLYATEESFHSLSISKPDSITDLDKKAAISQIRKNYYRINKQAESAKTIEKKVNLLTTEGGKAKAYFVDDQIIKIILYSFGETGKSTEEYYFNDDYLVFIFDVDQNYKKPMYVEDSKIIKTEENRY